MKFDRTFGDGLGTLLIMSQIFTTIASAANSKGENIQDSRGTLQTPDKFLKEVFPSSDINIIWQALTGGDSGSNSEHQQINRGTENSKSMALKSQPMNERQLLNEQALDVMCGRPQSVIIDSYKEMGIVKGMAFRIYPDCIRVNRCRNSGCCADGFVCKANETDMFNKQFLVYDADATQPTVHLLNRNVVNHVSCSCTPLFTCHTKTKCSSNHVWNNTTCACECTAKCPRPYVQDEVTCLCECQSNDNKCLKISKGITKLPKEQCRSLESNTPLPSCGKDKTFYIECCRCMKRPCEKAPSQNLRSLPSDKTPLAEQTSKFKSIYSSSFAASIISTIGEVSIKSKNYRYKITGDSTELYSSEDSSEDS